MTNSTYVAPSLANITNNDFVELVSVVVLHDGKLIPAPFFFSVQQQVEDSLPGLELGQRYTAKTLCSEAFWKQLSKSERLLAGRCLSYMVAQKILPLKPVARTGANAKQYRLQLRDL